jgi:hypothetical protein
MEIWKTIEEFPDYEVSSLGNIRNRDTKKVLKLRHSKSNKYVRIMLYDNMKPYTKTVHRIVAKAFIENPDGYKEIDHIDRNPKNNCVENLRWVECWRNKMNKTKQSNNTSGYKGVCWDTQKNKWRCEFNVNSKKIYVGSFDDDDLPYGICLMNAMLIDYFGEYAVLNE